MTGYALHAQTQTLAGDYYLKWECESHQIEYKLSLHEDGTYDLNTYTKDLTGSADVVHNDETGRWTKLDKLLKFFSKVKKGFDEEYTTDLNGSIARFIVATSTDAPEEENKTVLIFDSSKIYCIEGLEFVKIQ